jgi:hypothetical protein
VGVAGTNVHIPRIHENPLILWISQPEIEDGIDVDTVPGQQFLTCAQRIAGPSHAILWCGAVTTRMAPSIVRSQIVTVRLGGRHERGIHIQS